MTEILETEYDTRHGGAYDRGSADSYYHRPPRPHLFVSATYQSEEVLVQRDSPEWKAYMAGYEDNERFGDKKDWG